MNDEILDENETKTNESDSASSPSLKKEENLFFNSNVFGENYETPQEEEIEEAPPPPVFSEEELEAAKEDAFHRGKSEGVRESTESREQFVAGLLSDLTQKTNVLFEAEIEREKRFELESVRLSLAIFEQIFPHYLKEHGLDEMRQALLDVIQGEEGTSQVLIEVHPDYVEDIKTFVAGCGTDLPRDCCYDVAGVGTFNASQFKLSWKDGGAVYDTDAIASRIRDILHGVLAQGDTNDHNDDQNSVPADTIVEAQEPKEEKENTASEDLPPSPDNGAEQENEQEESGEEE